MWMFPQSIKDMLGRWPVGALYVRDDQANRLAKELAEQRGLTKVAAMQLALLHERAPGRVKPSVKEIVAELRRTSTLPQTNGGVADKAFFDGLYVD